MKGPAGRQDRMRTAGRIGRDWPDAIGRGQRRAWRPYLRRSPIRSHDRGQEGSREVWRRAAAKRYESGGAIPRQYGGSTLRIGPFRKTLGRGLGWNLDEFPGFNFTHIQTMELEALIPIP
jgi:hypothetical protein